MSALSQTLDSLLLLARMGRRNLGRNRRRTVVTVVGLGLGLALAMASWVLVDGYLRGTIDAMVGGTTGHFRVVHPGQLGDPNLFDVIPEPAQVAREVEQVAGVRAVAPRVTSAVLLAVGDRSAGAMLEGLDPQAEPGVSRRVDQVVEGRFVAAPAEVVLGLDLAEALQARPGSEVLAISQAADGSMANALWTVVGLADARSDTANQVLVWVTLDEAQSFLALDGAHVLVGVVEDADAVGPVVRAIAALPGFAGVAADLTPGAAAEGGLPANLRVSGDAPRVVRSWRAINPFMAQMYELGRSWTLIGVALVLITAGLGAANTMAMSVRERTRELGILIAVGMRPRQMIGLVLFESLALYVWSAVVGSVLGGALCGWLVREGLDYSDTSTDWVMAGVAVEPVIHGVWSAAAWWVPVLMLGGVTVVSSLLPALHAARLDPVQAMQRR
ncbi:MAG: ABC transporter permease [Alphaproteobacteria bacterium]|nr:ABC transporter permease [Alphaproteobacteria bacterium]